jgi:hypothetical protein
MILRGGGVADNQTVLKVSYGYGLYESHTYNIAHPPYPTPLSVRAQSILFGCSLQLL